MYRTKIPCGVLLILSLIFCAGCNKSEEIIGPTDKTPVITFDSEDYVFKVKVGKELLLEPTILNNENATYRWLLDGVTVGRDASYLFSSDDVGEYFVTFEVTTSVATVSEEIRVDVVELMPPNIGLAVPEKGFIMLAGTAKEFTPSVANPEEALFEWRIDNNKVASTKDYTFSSDEPGEFDVVFSAENEDGQRHIEFQISVRRAEDMPFSWIWEKDEYNMAVGRTIILGPLEVSDAADATYTWTINGTIVQEANSPDYTFYGDKEGEYLITVTALNEVGAFLSQELTVRVFNGEDAYFREITGSSSVDMVKVWEFLPAPGQFVNDYKDASGNILVINTMEEACAYAFESLQAQNYVSLGAFGGHIIVEFDHSIINDGGYNLQVLGNSFDGSSEPGIVWVMQDENGDGIPNDTWYELKGSEHRKPGTLYNYTVTYYRPQNDGADYPWTDNYGGSGTVDRNGFHEADYYPSWVESDSYLLRGTRLQDKTYDRYGNGTYWINDNFDWGYADNYGSDRLTDDANKEAGVNTNHFRISDAVDQNGDAVNLKYIDFVKVQTGVQAKAGWLGEVSTEVYGFRDYNMIKNKK